MASTFAARLRALRAEAGMTQHEVATSASITRDYLARVESGRQTPSVDVAARILGALGVSLADVADCFPDDTV